MNESEQPFSPSGLPLSIGVPVSASITNAAMDALQHENKRLKATLYLIRERIDDLAHEPMTPMLGHNIIEALNPQDADINHYIKNILERP